MIAKISAPIGSQSQLAYTPASWPMRRIAAMRAGGRALFGNGRACVKALWNSTSCNLPSLRMKSMEVRATSASVDA
jgi:hypothetical protein